MGRDCCDGGGGGRAISSSKSKRKPNGCMAAFYHLFDFHHFYFSSHHHHQLTIDSPSSSKSLKLLQESLPSTTYKDKQSLNIPVTMRVRTEKETRLRALATDTSTSSSEKCNSPSSKTPSLVARLMGLDLLPDNINLDHHLPNLHTMTKKGTRLGTRSLPESPRISSARKSDFDIHRLSLQLNKENKHEEFGCSRLKQEDQQENNQSPRDYARQIVKQIKEKVVPRRVVGMDITNSVKNRDPGSKSQNSNNELRRGTTVSCSPRTRFSEIENKPNTIHKTKATQKPKPKMILVSVSEEKQNQKRVKQRPINLCKKVESETRFSPRPLKQREAFFSESTNAKASNRLHKKKKFKKIITKSNDLDNISATEPPQKQKQINETQGLRSNEEEATISSTLIHKIEENSPQVARNYKLDDAATVSASEEIGIDSEKSYITRIINLAGINTDSATTMLDPSIFRKLERSGENQSGSLALKCDRRLLFDLVNDILIDTVKRRRNYNGSELIGELCSNVASYSHNRFPMEVDHLAETKKKVEEIVAEIERDFIDALVRETVCELSLNRRRNKNDVGGEKVI